MSDIAIRAEGLSKKYRIGETRMWNTTLRDQIASGISGIARLGRRTSDGDKREKGNFWALKDVSFEVKQGDVVGVIGRNGAGKSTLLKVLSRITEPTEGYADMHGRVGSLLEVGTGFHPELSGRENIYLNGAILGMRRAEIEQKFDEIVAFAEVDKFIDTPVKRYSSGMYVRLAFAVAAHMNTEILLMDEVLAVGDAAFQKKCLGKISDVAKAGRTVLFVSHNMAAVGRLCNNALWFDQGNLVAAGSAKSTITKYLSVAQSESGHHTWPEISSAPGDELMRVRSVSILDSNRKEASTLYQDQPFNISITYQVLERMMNANVGFEIKTEDGITIFTSYDADNPAWTGRGRERGIYVAEAIIPANLLNEGAYYLTLAGGVPQIRISFLVEDVLMFEVGPPISGGGPTGRMGAARRGLLTPEIDWSIKLEGIESAV